MKNSLIKILMILLIIILTVGITACSTINRGIDDVKRSIPSVDDADLVEKN